jgi:ATP-binding cassette, subfamily B, bacterial
VLNDDVLLATTGAAAGVVAHATGLGERWRLDPIVSSHPDLERGLRAAGPAVLSGPGGHMAVRRVRRWTTVALTPEGRHRRLRTAAVCDWLTAPLDAEAAAAAAVDRLRPEIRGTVLRAQLASARVAPGFRVLPPFDAGLRVLARRVHLWGWLGLVAVAHAAVYAAFLVLWTVIGGAAARGDLTTRAVGVGAMILFLLVPLRGLAAWSAGTVTIDGGGLLKRRLLGAILAVDPDGMRHRGAGQLLGITLESEALETVALTGGYLGVLAAAELIVAGIGLAAGARGQVLLPLLMFWVAGSGLLAHRYLRRRRAWSRSRLGLTHELVERMVGHRTRLAQEGRALHDHTADRHQLGMLDRRARTMDRTAAALAAAVPRGWAVAGLAAMFVALPVGTDPARIAAGLDGVLLAFHGLEKLGLSLTQLTDAVVAWDHVGPLLRTTGAGPDPIDPAPVPVVLDGVSYGYDGRAVLQDVTLAVNTGDRILLQGGSGAGKSTLAALLSGSRLPSSGSVTGSSTVTAAPQYHENHVFSASFAFNLLLGRRWPPTDQDLRDAWDVCVELGLEPLLTTMPSGIEQPVGEVGWQLSHGERSRLYVARALLTQANVVILDEAFATLDPVALSRTLRCVLTRAGALLVIAHE